MFVKNDPDPEKRFYNGKIGIVISINNDTIEFDSLPYFIVPYYLSKTNDIGRFQFNGLSDDDYLLFAINDQNSNYIFDQPGEQIAFLDNINGEI